MRGRKKKTRCLSYSAEQMICSCFGPLKLPAEQLAQRPKVALSADEMQTLVDRDIQNISMEEGSARMQISKTVYAGIYTAARKKLTTALVEWAVLTVLCPEEWGEIFTKNT